MLSSLVIQLSLSGAVYASNRGSGGDDGCATGDNDGDGDDPTGDDDPPSTCIPPSSSASASASASSSPGLGGGLDRSAALSHGDIAGVAIGALAGLALLALLALVLVRRRRRALASASSDASAQGSKALLADPGATTPYPLEMRMADLSTGVVPMYAPSVVAPPADMHQYLAVRRDAKVFASQTSLPSSAPGPQAQFRQGFPPTAPSTAGESAVVSDTGALDGHEEFRSLRGHDVEQGHRESAAPPSYQVFP
ncbi:hypothetical protein FA95DRAFT_1609810 [Auriscalpium vulgare]|uniref:Uncharacterized protein n=1 Tax=Auriscalpium vulgare TaxID=40419 RepID=A0ACB8RFY2_9AGAM|nr:hypothetical protein FA95DRAFT_1609810 [Auriscalpium vulgare]